MARVGNRVVVKQFKFDQNLDSFCMELDILQKIRALNLENNGGFPVLLSHQSCYSHGEIMMTNVGTPFDKLLNFGKMYEKPPIAVGWER